MIKHKAGNLGNPSLPGPNLAPHLSFPFAILLNKSCSDLLSFECMSQKRVGHRPTSNKPTFTITLCTQPHTAYFTRWLSSSHFAHTGTDCPGFAFLQGMLKGQDLSAAYASADVFLMPSETETLGFVALEAMASGLPVVAVAAGGLTDIITHPGITGQSHWALSHIVLLQTIMQF